MGTATYSPVNKHPIVIGNKLISFGTITMSNSYATGGDSIDWTAETGIGKVEYVSSPPTIGGYVLVPNAANTKIMAFYADYDAAGDGALIQVAATTDLSAQTAQIMIIGRR